MAKLQQPAIFAPEIQSMMTIVEESTRSTAESIKYFLEPAPGVLERAKSRRHHIVFGRRGSGKSSLLRKTYADHLVARRPAAFVDLEEFKGHSYPDVLVSILIKTLSEFQNWIETAAVAPATKTSFWSKISIARASPAKIAKNKANALRDQVVAEIEALNAILHEPDEAKVVQTLGRENSTKAEAASSLKAETPAGGASVTASLSGSESKSSRVESAYSSKKVEALHRNIMRYKSLFNEIAATSGVDAFLLLDDLYHIRTSDQAEVIDYFHRIAKNSKLWLKIGTIRHRTRWYQAGDPPIGVKLGDDIDQIDLDITLENYQTTKNFLFRILDQFAQDTGVKLSEILADGARDRLVLASGGVARDFLGLFRKAASDAQERIQGKDLARGEKIGAEDVNRAAGSYYENKTEELKRDTQSADLSEIDDQIAAVRDFCISNVEANCFLIEKDIDSETDSLLGELVDLKFIHHVRSRVSVRGKDRKVYDAYMLDLSFYTGERARRGFEMIEFWGSGTTDSLRKPRLVFKEK